MPVRPLLVTAALAGAIALAGAGCGAEDGSSPATRFAQSGLVSGGTVEAGLVRQVGQGADIAGLTGTVVAAAFRPALSHYEDDGFLVVDVGLKNTGARPRPYHFLSWRLQTPVGAIVDPILTSLRDLDHGDLDPGEEISGPVVFPIGAETGDFKVVYKPLSDDPASGVWTVGVAPRSPSRGQAGVG